MSNTWNNLKQNIKNGLEGKNQGIPFRGFTTLSDYVCNIQPGRYDLIFAASGNGKTSFVNGAYVYGAIKYLQENPNHINKLKIIYFSLELTAEEQLGKYMCSRLWEDHGILISYVKLLSKGKNKCDPKILPLLDVYEEEMKEIEDKYIDFHYYTDPKSFISTLVKYAQTIGELVTDDDGNVIQFISNDPDLITLIVIDHIGLVSLGELPDIKKAMDSISKSCVTFRNIFRFSPVVISQINRSSEQMDRRGDGDNWMPMSSDTKNSGNLIEDCNTAIGIASPFALMIENCLGYDITKFKDRYRLAKIVKNRDGPTGQICSFSFIGEIGQFRQLKGYEEYLNKKPQEIADVDNYYINLHSND